MNPRPRPQPYQVTASDGTVVLVKPSYRRTRTVSAQQSAGRVTLLVPARLSPAQVRSWADHFLARGRVKPKRACDSELARLAHTLSARYFNDRAVPTSISWSTRQNLRWGSCTQAEGSIRISHRLVNAPPWVLEAVVVHELAHLLEAGHGPAFTALVAAYPHYDRAMAYLDGVAFGLALAG